MSSREPSLPVRRLSLPKLPAAARPQASAAQKSERRAYSRVAQDFIPHAVYDRYRLAAGAEFAGPAIIEERESTVVVGERAHVRVDEYGFLWVNLPQE